MKIAYLSASTLPSRTANSIHVMKMCQALARAGHDVSLYAPDIGEGVEAGIGDIHAYYGVERTFSIHKTWWSNYLGRSYVSGYLSARHLADRHFDFGLARCLPSAWFAANAGVPVLFEFHQPISDSGRLSWLNEWLFKRLIRHPCFIGFVAITRALAQDFLERYPELEGRIHVAADGADPFPEGIEPVPLSAAAGRLQLGYVGHLYPGKGMEVIAALCRRIPEADFHIIGGLERDVGAWRAKLEGQPNIQFHGFVPHSQTPAWILALDIVLLPNQRDISWHSAGGNIGQWTSPLKMFEYMSAAKPIIASDLEVLREVLDDGVNALLCTPDDIDAWSGAVQLLRNDELRHSLGARARQDFMRHYTWQRRAERLLAILDDMPVAHRASRL